MNAKQRINEIKSLNLPVMGRSLPRHKAYPRLVKGDQFGGRPDSKLNVRLTCTRFMSLERWNQIGSTSTTFAEQFATAKKEADATELKNRAAYAQVANALAVESIAYDAAANGRTFNEQLISMIK